LENGGVTFAMGSRDNGAKNAVRCNKQSITLPSTKDSKLYLLMASTNKNGSLEELTIDDQTYTIEVPYYGGVVGQLASPYNAGTYYRHQDIALTTTHCHNISNNSNEAYSHLYIYKYVLPLHDDAKTLQLPADNTLYLLAATTSSNTIDDITPLTTLNTYINYCELSSPEDEGCGTRLVPHTVSASHQNNSNEGAKMAADEDEMTKWCVTSDQSHTPYLEYRFTEPMQICQWMVLNAGNEASDYITKACQLQSYENGTWTDVDVVTNNHENKIVRGVTPFITNRVRLLVTQGEKNGYTTRINEFAVFGKPASTLNIDDLTVVDDNHCPSLQLYGNTPNPCAGTTQIRCHVPQGIDKLTLHITTLDGRQVCRQDYDAHPGAQSLSWHGALPEGIYLYYLKAHSKGRQTYTNAKRLIVSYHQH